MKNSKLSPLLIGLISAASTVVFYLLIFGDIFSTPMVWISLLTLLIAECIVTLKAVFIKQNIMTQTVTLTSCAYLAAVLLLSILFVSFFRKGIEAYICINILALCALAVIDLSVLYFTGKASASDKKLAQSQSVMDACYAKAQALATIYSQSDCKDALLEIAELIKYSDNSELTDDEANIINKLDELEAQLKVGNENVSALIAEIKNIINLRTIKMKSIKRGGY